MKALNEGADLLAKIIETIIEAKADDGKLSNWEKAGLAKFIPALIRFIKDRDELLTDVQTSKVEAYKVFKDAFNKQLELSDELLEAKIEIGVELLVHAAILAKEITDFVKDIKDDL